MGAIKRYIEDVLYETVDAVFTEASEPLKAYGDYDREEFAEATAEHLFNGEAIKVWNFIRGLKGDMEYDAETPLLDKAKERVFTLVPFGDIARDVAQFTYDYDPYGFRDAWGDMDDAIDDNMKLLTSDPGSLLEWLKECLEDMNGNYEFYLDMIVDCEKLIERIKPLTVKRRTYREGIEAMKAEWVGKQVSYEGNQYTVVDVDYNGALMINKPSGPGCPYHLETTAIGTWMIDKEER